MGGLEGRVAIITGAATGIGRATALLFARAGARLTLADARGDELDRTVAAVRVAGGEAVPVIADLARPEDCASVVAAAMGAAGRLDIVFNNAGVGTMVVGGTVETIALDKWDLALDVNVRAMYFGEPRRAAGAAPRRRRLDHQHRVGERVQRLGFAPEPRLRRLEGRGAGAHAR